MGKKITFSEEQIHQVKKLFDLKFGSRVISKKLGITRWAVQVIYKKLGIYNIGRKTPKTITNRNEYECKTCGMVKDIINFRKRIKKATGRVSHESSCLICEKQMRNENAKKRAKKLRKTDVGFALRRSISYFVWKALKKSNSSKNNSCMKYIDYTIQELKDHLENQFEPWMTWNNYGVYSKKLWKNGDDSTWTWQLDHIIPQSDLPYISMKEANFNKCWALNNLRPLSSKQNHIDGIFRVRHKVI